MTSISLYRDNANKGRIVTFPKFNTTAISSLLTRSILLLFHSVTMSEYCLNMPFRFTKTIDARTALNKDTHIQFCFSRDAPKA